MLRRSASWCVKNAILQRSEKSQYISEFLKKLDIEIDDAKLVTNFNCSLIFDSEENFKFLHCRKRDFAAKRKIAVYERVLKKLDIEIDDAKLVVNFNLGGGKWQV